MITIKSIHPIEGWTWACSIATPWTATVEVEASGPLPERGTLHGALILLCVRPRSPHLVRLVYCGDGQPPAFAVGDVIEEAP